MNGHDKGHNYKLIIVTENELLTLMGGWKHHEYVSLPTFAEIPNDAEVHAVEYRIEYRGFALLLWHPTFPVVEREHRVPIFSGEMMREVVRIMPNHPRERDERGWIQTFTGRQAWPLRPAEEDICIEDIAHALSMICRYTGHVREFYSVAQHSVIASKIVPLEDAQWALLHDATEAYLCDVARPVKPFLGDYKKIERRLMNCIANVFNLSGFEPESVKHADLVLLATERRDLMASPPVPWISTENISPLTDRIHPLPPAEAKKLFLDRFKELFQVATEAA